MSRAGATATYLYCLLRSSAPPPVAAAPPGLPGASPPRAVDAGGGIWLIVADAPLAGYGEEEIALHLEELPWVSERALAHESVVEHFLAAGPLLPAKLFTLFHDDGRALAHVEARRAELERALDRVEGCLEWGLRVRFDAARAAAASPKPAELARPAGGRDFLLRKKEERDAAKVLPAHLRGRMDELFADLAGAAREARRHALPPDGAGASLLLDSAFLVPEAGAERFEAAVREWAERLAPLGCEVTLTGPWPPHNFVGEAP